MSCGHKESLHGEQETRTALSQLLNAHKSFTGQRPAQRLLGDHREKSRDL